MGRSWCRDLRSRPWAGDGSPGAGGRRAGHAEGGYIVPGFVNMHVHGASGYDTLDASADSLAAMHG